MVNVPLAFDPPSQAMRAASRTNLYLAATLVGRRSRLAVTLRNLSATGALVRARVPLQGDGPVSLIRGSLRVEGMLAWTDGCSGGLSFDEPIDLAEWAPAASRGQSAVDQRIAHSRDEIGQLDARRDAVAAPPADQANLIARIAEELAFASRRLEGLGSELADDPTVVRRYPAQLHQIDITMQTLAHLGRLLLSDRPAALLATIGIDDLRRRLERVPLG